MASNFRISRYHEGANLHLKVTGDFDGSSAKELLNVLEDSHIHESRVIVHMDGLKDIDPFGRWIFQEELSRINISPINVVFEGEKGDLSS